MSKTSKIILWCVLIVVLAMHRAVHCCEAARGGHDVLRRWKDVCRVSAARRRDAGHHGRGFTITAHKFENMCTQNRASGMTETVAAQYTLARYIVTRSLYYQAVTDGYAAADAAVQQDIDDTRAAAQTADKPRGL